MARSRNRNRRMFVWARSGGVLFAGTGGAAGIDLLQSVRDRYGGKEFVGATVMSVRGYVRPNIGGADALHVGRVGLRIMNERLLPAPNATGTISTEVGPGSPQMPEGVTEAAPEEDWMAFLPFFLPSGPNNPNPEATWNEGASPWSVHVRSSRRMEELTETLGLVVQSNQAADPQAFYDYDLSVGLKLS